MAKRRSFVPESPMNASLEGRVVLSTLGSVGDWFSSQYKHVKEDLGFTHKHNNNAAAGIQNLWDNSATLSKPIPAGTAHHSTARAHHRKGY